jgi:hypothetical protein
MSFVGSLHILGQVSAQMQETVGVFAWNVLLKYFGQMNTPALSVLGN